MKAIKQCFNVVLFALQGASNRLKSVDETLVCYPWNKWKLLSSTFMRYCLNIMPYKVVLTFNSAGNSSLRPLKLKPLNDTLCSTASTIYFR